MDDNYIRRERRRKVEAKRKVEEMREALPIYTLDDIRHRRLPFHEALLKTFEDRHYMFTAQYVRKLFNVQEESRQISGPLSQAWTMPQLYLSTEELTTLCDLLTKSEDYRKSGNLAMECETFLQTATYFAFLNKNWWWLGEQLLLQSLALSTKYTSLGGKYEALNRYVYSKFLIDNYKQYESVTHHLKIARDLSNGREWTTKLVFPGESDVLFLQVNFLLYCCLIRQVEQLMKTDVKGAGKLADVAKKRATDACYHEGAIKALLLKGMCEISCNETKKAIQTFSKAYYLQSAVGNKKGICEARIQLARAYLLDGNAQLSLNTLLLLRESAEDYNLPYYLAQAYKHLGEFFLNNGEAQKATPLLAEALKIFHECGYVNESEKLRNLEAISTGLELFPKYLVLLAKSDKGDYLRKLIDWKDSRKVFKEDEIIESYSIEEIIQESISQLENLAEEQEEEQEEEADYEEETTEENDETVLELHVHEEAGNCESATGLASEEENNN